MPAQSVVACSIAPDLLAVTKIHGRVHPESSTYIVAAADGRDYFLKAFPQRYASFHARSEVLACVVGRRLGLPMAHWRALELDDQTLAAYRAGTQQQEGVEPDLCSGVHFGSLYNGTHNTLVRWLPKPVLWKNEAVASSSGCIRLFDVWVGNAGIREAAILYEDGYPHYIYFFSHAHIFQSEARKPDDERACNAYAAACQIAGITAPINSFLARLFALTRAELYEAFNEVPPFWRRQASEMSAIAFLENRRDWLRRLARVGFNREMAKTLPPPALMCDTWAGSDRSLQIQPR